MRCSILQAAMAVVILGTSADAATITFDTDPFAGTTALTTPGRQIIGNELFITFDIATDVFQFNRDVFGVDTIAFANDLPGNLATSGLTVIVNEDLGPPMAAGTAAGLLAAQITAPGPGFFVYFNTGLNVPRLVYSTNLDDPTADLKVLARLTNLTGQPGELAKLSARNFAVPEPATLLLTAAGIAAFFQARRRQLARR
jgi:hypothetical protein